MKIRGELLYPHGLIPVSTLSPSPDLTGGVRKALQLPGGRAQSHNWITTDGAGAWEPYLAYGFTTLKWGQTMLVEGLQSSSLVSSAGQRQWF